MIAFWKSEDELIDRVYIPKYYDPGILRDLEKLEHSHTLMTIGEMVQEGTLLISTGDEIGKMAYGTGNIPFIRTSDFSNWEIKHDPKQGISEEIYSNYSTKQNLQVNDICL